MNKSERIRLDSMTIASQFRYANRNKEVFANAFPQAVGHDKPFYLPKFNLHSQGRRIMECTFTIVNDPDDGLLIYAWKLTDGMHYERVKNVEDALKFFNFEPNYEPIGYWD